MLSNGYTPDHCLEFVERGESLAHVEPGVHLSHVGDSEVGRDENDGATEVSAATAQKTTSIRVQGMNRAALRHELRNLRDACSLKCGARAMPCLGKEGSV